MKEMRKPQTFSVRIASNVAKIQTGNLTNTSMEHYCYTNLLSEVQFTITANKTIITTDNTKRGA